MRKFIIFLVVVIIIGLAVFGWSQGWFTGTVTTDGDDQTEEENGTSTDTGNGSDSDNGGDSTGGQPAESVIGSSADGNEIVARHFGEGDKEVLFVGGIHGGYSWNTALVAYELIDHLEDDPATVPAGVRVTVVPVLNPDGLKAVVGTAGRFDPSAVPSDKGETVPGRFNGNEVDLNRNFDCDWQAEGTWQDRTVDAGSQPFSEPESRAIRDYIEANDPAAVVVWYSSAGGVFASSCYNGVLPETLDLTNAYADASGYSAHEEFDFYQITGDMVNWLAKEEIPAISVLLSDHQNTEWSKNRRGVEAILDHYAR